MLEDGRKLKLSIDLSAEELLTIIKTMFNAAKETYTQEELLSSDLKVMLLFTGGTGDFAVTIKVNCL